MKKYKYNAKATINITKKISSKSQSTDKQKFLIHCNIEEILFKSTRNAIEIFEYSPIDSLINLMRSVYDVSEYELLTNYDLFEKSLRQTVPNHVVDVILHCLKEELLQYTSTKNSYLAINDILVKIQQKNNK